MYKYNLYKFIFIIILEMADWSTWVVIAIMLPWWSISSDSESANVWECYTVFDNNKYSSTTVQELITASWLSSYDWFVWLSLTDWWAILDWSSTDKNLIWSNFFEWISWCQHYYSWSYHDTCSNFSAWPMSDLYSLYAVIDTTPHYDLIKIMHNWSEYNIADTRCDWVEELLAEI